MHTQAKTFAPLNDAVGRPAPVTPCGSSQVMHLLALVTALATFPLIFMGGLVTSHHAGMSVPDWPNSYHYNMFLFPPSKWVGGILYEHTHRLMASAVGFLSILLVLWAWRAQIINFLFRIIGVKSADTIAYRKTLIPAEPHRYLALAVLAVVLLQGVLGGLRVVLVNLDLAIVHACVAQAFFCLAAYAALVTSRSWEQTPRLSAGIRSSHLFTLGCVTVAVIYLQLIVGATMRHFDAGLAIPDLPLAYGKILPPTNAEGLNRINHIRAFSMNLDPVTLGQVWLHFAHRIGAVLVSVLVVAFAVAGLVRSRRGRNGHSAPSRSEHSAGLATPAILLLLLLCAQLTLGVLTVILRKPADVASSHVAVGALVLMTSFVLTCRARRVGRGEVNRATMGLELSRNVALQLTPVK